MSEDGARKAMMKGELLQRAAQLFAEKGFSSTSLQDIADAIGLSRSALYYYFSSKEAVLTALVEEVTISEARNLENLRETFVGTPSQQLHAAVQIHVLWILERPIRFRVIDSNELEFPKKLAKKHNAAKRKVLDAFTRIIEEGVEEGEFRPINAKIAAFSVIGMCNWTAWWFSPAGKLSAQKVAVLLADMAINSIRRDGDPASREAGADAAIQSIRENLDYLEKTVG